MFLHAIFVEKPEKSLENQKKDGFWPASIFCHSLPSKHIN